MKPKDFYENLEVTVGWSLFPQIVEKGSNMIYATKKLEFIFYKECYPNKGVNDWPVNPYTNKPLPKKTPDATKQKPRHSNTIARIVRKYFL